MGGYDRSQLNLNIFSDLEILSYTTFLFISQNRYLHYNRTFQWKNYKTITSSYSHVFVLVNSKSCCIEIFLVSL